MQEVELNLDFSHWCSVKDHLWNTDYKPVNEGENTHDWEFRIKDAKDGDMRHYIEKIVISSNKLGLSKVLTKPPYVVRESGNKNVGIKVDIYFKGISEKDPAKKTTKQYALILSPSLEELSSGKKDNLKREKTHTQRKLIKISHKDPSVIKGLVKGGGKLLEDEIDIQRREKTYSDRLEQIEHVKKVRAVGYRLYKSDPNRPPTPDPSDVEKIKRWKMDLLELQSSEDVEISPEEVKEMVTEAKKAYPYTFYNANIPPDHDLRVVKTPEPEELLRGDEWDDMFKTWIKDISKQTPNIKTFIKEKELEKSRETMRLKREEKVKNDISKFKESISYQAVLLSGKQRPPTPGTHFTNNSIKNWKNEIYEKYKILAKFMSDRQHRDINAMKDTLLYMEYAKAYHFKKVRHVKDPQGENCLTLKDWELKFEQWKFELKDVVDEYNKQRKRSSEIASDVSSSAKQPKISNEALEKSFVNSGNLQPFEKSVLPIQPDEKSSPEKCSESVKKIAIDFKLLLSLDANTDMMEYIQGISQSYTESLDKKYPDGRQFIGSIVGGCIRFIPCGHYNKDNSCDLEFVHNDQNDEKRIHACALCYYVLGGMINVHRLIHVQF